ncbi:MAG: dUTP diphosphatase [Gemmatimonadales bacterium]|nr:MAG: dUTP diphosphatase [Gemmatimonadales bacterium]
MSERPANSSGPGGGGEGVVRFRRLESNPDLPLPARATEGSAGFDLRSSEETFILEPGARKLVASGLEMEMPSGLECQIRPRSGLALRHGVTIPNSPGTIDPDYRGELRVILLNLGEEAVQIERGERIAQLIFSRFSVPRLEEVENISASERGQDGFGSTGTR